MKLRQEISKELGRSARTQERWRRRSRCQVHQEQRHALRGLLLCQRVYYSKIWAKKTFSPGNIVADEWSLPDDWKNTSQKFLGRQVERDILEALGCL